MINISLMLLQLLNTGLFILGETSLTSDWLAASRMCVCVWASWWTKEDRLHVRCCLFICILQNIADDRKSVATSDWAEARISITKVFSWTFFTLPGQTNIQSLTRVMREQQIGPRRSQNKHRIFKETNGRPTRCVLRLRGFDPSVFHFFCRRKQFLLPCLFQRGRKRSQVVTEQIKIK